MRYGKWVVSVVAMAAMSVVSGPVHAEEKPTDGAAQPPAYYGPDTRDFPQTLAGKVPDAIAQKAHARMTLQRSRHDLAGLFGKMRFGFDRSESFQQAAKSEKEAFAAYEAARQKALAKLADDENYRAVTGLRDELGERIGAMQGVAGITPETLVPLAEEKLNYARAASAMEQQALANDPDVVQARDRFIEAGTKLAQTKNQFEDSMRYHPDVETARAKVGDAQVAAVTTAAYSRALVRVTEEAIDYAYFINRKPQRYGYAGYDYGNTGYYGQPYGYYGYGYGR
jgi:hypothetical protein